MSHPAWRAARIAALAGILGATGLGAAWIGEAAASGQAAAPPGDPAQPALTPWLRLTPGDIAPDLRFGAALATWGNTALIGAPGLGAAYTFAPAQGPQLAEEAALLPPAPEPGFGAAVAVWGDTALVGAPGGIAATTPGVVHVYIRGEQGWQEQAVLSPAGGEAGDAFGAAVALSGDTAVVGAPFAAGEDDAPGAGAAHVFTRRGRQWTEQARLVAVDAPPGAALGTAVAAFANTIVVGAPYADGQALASGAAYVFTRDAGAWTAAAKLAGDCGFTLPPTLARAMQLRAFEDSDNGKTYCLLMEVEDADRDGRVDRGWGTFLIDFTAVRDLGHNAPHAHADSTTETQAIDVFKLTDSRTYLMCGAHRSANAAASACDPDYLEADCAHSNASMYYPTVQEIDRFYGFSGHTQIEWHGKAGTTCPDTDVYLSPGLATAPPPGAVVLALESRVEQYSPTWIADVPGEDTCHLNGTDNISGRSLNGVPDADVCTHRAEAATERFLHIEQDFEQRDAARWAPAIKDTWPLASPPAAPTGLAATPGNAQVRLTWIHTSGADSYRVWTSGLPGGPWAEVASGLTGTTYTHTGLTIGTPYHYVVTAVNPAGEGPVSAEVVATPFGGPPPPQGLTATAGKKKVALRWAGSPGATTYRWKRGTASGGPYTLIKVTTVTSALDSAVTPGVTYYYVVTAVNTQGESAASNEASATPY